MQTIVYRESQIWEIKEGIYTKSLTKNRVCVIFHNYARYSKKRITQIYKALYGGAMLVSLWGAQIWLLEINRNIYFWVLLQMHEFIALGSQKDWSNIYFETRNV